MTAPVMPAEAAEWIRANVWTGKMRDAFLTTPGFYLECACQDGLTTFCRNDEHDECHRSTPLHDAETSICRRGGVPATFKKSFRHKALTSATGPHRTRYAEVWLADRVCRWRCPCECHPKQMTFFPQGVRS